MKKKITYGIIILSAAAVGVVGGFVGKRFLGSENVIYTGGSNSLKPDSEAIFNKVSKYTGTNNLFDEFEHYEVVNYAFEKYRRCENCFSTVIGLADTIVKQDIRNSAIKNGDEYFEESLSKSSVVALSTRFRQTNKNSDVTVYKGDKKALQINSDDSIVSYNESNKELSEAEDFSNSYGRLLDEMFNYVITDKTILNSEIQKNNDSTTIVLQLDPDLSTYFYKHQMQYISNLDKLPVFSDVKVTLTLNSEYYPTHMLVDENYIATVVVDAATHGTLESFFHPNEYYKIPEINESYDYKMR